MLPPVLPSKIVGIGKNYADHATEMGGDPPDEPLMFLKPNTAVIGPGGMIRLPEQSQRVDYEAELAVVIGKLCRHVDAEDADLYAAVDTLIDKLDRQVQKYKQKAQDHHRDTIKNHIEE